MMFSNIVEDITDVKEEDNVDTNIIAQYIIYRDFGFVAQMLSWSKFVMCKKIGISTFTESTFVKYEPKHTNQNAIRYVISSGVYLTLDPNHRGYFTKSDCSWALQSQTYDKDLSHLFDMGLIQSGNRGYQNHVFISNMSKEEYSNFVATIGGFPVSKFYIFFHDNRGTKYWKVPTYTTESERLVI